MNNTGIPKVAIFVFVLFLSGITFVLGLTVGRADTLLHKNNNKDSQTTYTLTGDKDGPKEVTVDFDRFWEVWSKMQNEYVDPNLDQQKMVDGAIKGMVDSIGDHATLYYTAEETSAYEEVSAGNFEGIGAELGYDAGRVIVKNPLNGSPAKAAGLLPGDLILKVNDEDVANLDINEVVLKIRGEKGTKVKIQVQRANEKESKTYEITRDEIHLESIEIDKSVDNNGILVLRINRFTESDYNKFVSQWDKVMTDVTSQNPKGVIIDLRGNPGGYLSGAVYTANEFLNKGTVVLYVQDREGVQQKYEAARSPKLGNIPIVILVNENTASAAEIFTGALRHYGKAVVIGTKTVGKGTAQQVIKPESWGGASIHITIQKWLLPDKSWLNPENPIKPDIEIENSDDDIKNGRDPQMDKAFEELKKKL